MQYLRLQYDSRSVCRAIPPIYSSMYNVFMSSFTLIESVSLYSTVHVCTSQVFAMM